MFSPLSDREKLQERLAKLAGGVAVLPSPSYAYEICPMPHEIHADRVVALMMRQLALQSAHIKETLKDLAARRAAK